MSRNKSLIIAGVVVVAAAAWVVLGEMIDEDVLKDQSAPSTQPISSPAMAGYVVHVDPATGRITTSPNGGAPVELDSKLLYHLSTSSEGLEEVPSPVPGGGVMIDLEGRFQNAFVTVVDDSGRVGVVCTSGSAQDGGERGEVR